MLGYWTGEGFTSVEGFVSADDEEHFGAAILALAAHHVVAGLQVHGGGAQDGDRLPARPAVSLHRRHRDLWRLEGPGMRRHLVHGCVGKGHVRAPTLCNAAGQERTCVL